MQNTIILGFGNPLLSDDGIGTKIVGDLEKHLDKRLFNFADMPTCCLEIIDIITGYQELIVIDGQKTQEIDPGKIGFYSVENYRATTHLDNYHDISFRDIISLGRKLGYKIPEDIDIIAVEIFEDKIFNSELSTALQKYYPIILGQIKGYIKGKLKTVLTT